MSKKKKQPGGIRPATPPAAPPPAPSGAHPRRGPWIAAGIVALAAIASGLYLQLAPHTPPTIPAVAKSAATQPPADYSGAASCKQCHEKQFQAWTGSDHDLAMKEATATTVLGDFGNARFRHFGVESTFFKRDGKFMVRTDGAEGKLAEFEIKHTFGVKPLQQYLVEFPGGRRQALSIAWDSRPKAAGGQRWFSLSPNEKIDPQDQLHWTGLYQNWNLQCAACHSTNLKKGYDAASKTYKTTFSDINVACESCHGPASRHLEWAKQAKAPYAKDADKGLTRLDSRWAEAWKFPTADARYAQRDKPADAAAMNTCAACHARRSTVAEAVTAGAPLEDSHRLAMLTAPNYHADGQQRDEVYTWGSFLQSRMAQRGVTCMDCHEPHTQKLRAEGNALCSRCHNATVFDTEKHHAHKAGGKGAQCVECHMPAQNYMVIDARRDHSLRVPRPDLSETLGSPNACTQCHTDRKPEWAAAAMDKHYGKAWRARPEYGSTLHQATTRGARSLPSLLAVAEDGALPGVVRATAATLATPYMRADMLPAAQKLLRNPEPSVRIAALGMLESFDAAARVQAAAPLLSDPVRGVRVEAARLIATEPDDQLPATQREARARALKEYVESLQQDLDWPSANVNLGNLLLRQGRGQEAIESYRRAIALDARYTGAYVNLADALRQVAPQGTPELEGEKILRRGLVLLPRAAELHHALGLLLVRKGDKAAAQKELSLAAKLAPDNARYAYVEAVGLNSAGKRDEALAILRAADARHPYNMEILSALISINREAGNARDTLLYAKKAAEVLPNDENLKKLVTGLEAKQ